MNSCKTLLNALRTGAHDKSLAALYALDGTQDSLDKARDRACRVVQSLIDTFCPEDSAAAALFSGPGRTEIGGNHTDHQHGRVLCGSVDMDMLACAVPNGLACIRIQSEGYPALEIALDDLSAREEEKNTSAALVRGVAAWAIPCPDSTPAWSPPSCPARDFPPPPPTRRWWAISSTTSAVRTSWTLSPSPKSASTPKIHTLASPAA